MIGRYGDALPREQRELPRASRTPGQVAAESRDDAVLRAMSTPLLPMPIDNMITRTALVALVTFMLVRKRVGSGYGTTAALVAAGAYFLYGLASAFGPGHRGITRWLYDPLPRSLIASSAIRAEAKRITDTRDARYAAMVADGRVRTR